MFSKAPFQQMIYAIAKWIILSLVLFSPCFSQTNSRPNKQITFQHFTSEEGLSQNSVYCIWQDHQGFIWFGTDEGLNRFDGYSFKIYKKSPFDNNTLPSNRIYALFEDQAGDLWIGTRQGLCRFDRTRTKFTHYRYDTQNPNSISNDMVKAIFEDHTGTLWVGTEGGGLNLLDRATGNFTRYLNNENSFESISSNNVKTIFEDQKGMLWIGTDRGLNRFDRVSKKFTSYFHNVKDPNSLSDDTVTAIYEADTEHLWIGTSKGLNLFSQTQESFTPLKLSEKLASDEMITKIFRDQTGMVWIGTNNGLHRWDVFNNEDNTYLPVPKDPSSLSSNRVSAIYQDRSGALWFGTYFGGINRFDPLSQRFSSYLADLENINNLSKNIWAIYLDRKEILWIGTNDGLIEMERSTGKIVEIYRHNPNDPNSLRSSHIDALIEDNNGVLWVGSNGGGLHSFDRVTKKFTAYLHDDNNPFSMSSDKIRAFHLDRAGTLWIGTLGGGLNRYDRAAGRFYAYRHNSSNPDTISGDLVRAFCEDQEGNLWVGTESGLNKFDRQTGKFTAYRQNPKDLSSISSDVVNYLYIDLNNIMWVATTGGLNRFDMSKGTFTSITEIDGLANNTINGIIEDSKSTLWLSTNRGITNYDPIRKIIKNFDTRDGLPCREFNGRACYYSPQGEMFFGGNNGFTSFYGEKIEENNYVPPIVITSIKLFDKVLEKAKLWLIPGSKEANTPLMLSYQENFISFEFSALSYQVPERNQYAYMLVGIDDDWVAAQTRRYISYSKIPPGEYIFKVKGSNSDGRWNEAGIAIHIIITPPFWQTRTAYILYILFAFSVIYSGVTYRLRALRNQNLLLETTVAERTVELANALSEIKINNNQLIAAKEALEQNNRELDIKNKQLDEKIVELVSAQQQADRIFSALAEALPGTVLEGKYRLEERIGAGGFGAVYRATHLLLEKEVAVKIFKPVPGNDSEESLERFRFEAVSTCKINHPNAVTVLDSGISAEGIAYLVMELLKGCTLKAEIQRLKLLTPLRSAQILLPVCQVLEKAHSLGIIHRDIKPDNIFLHQEDGKEIVKILDFGIAKLMEVQESLEEKFSATSKLIGTPAYISPERLTGMPYDGKSDIYSLGVILYEMLSGQLPFQRNSSGFLGLIQMHLTSEPPPLNSINSDIPQEVSDIVASALARELALRPTAAELSQNLLASLSLRPEQLIDANGYCLANSTSSISLQESEEQEAITMVSVLPQNTDEQSRLAKRIFLALSKSLPETRKHMLEQACGNNLALQKEVLSLLKANEETKENIFTENLAFHKEDK